MKPRALTATRVNCLCEHPECGKTFVRTAYQVSVGRGKYCSQRCHSSMNARRNHERYPMTGDRNPMFKGWKSRDKRAYVDAFRARYPEKALAHDCVEWAIRTGRLVKPETCQKCARKPTEPLHSHHEDYSRPLIVDFFCRDCHRTADAERRARLGERHEVAS